MGQVPRVAIRADASAAIGTGHLRRCLALAQALRELGADVTLVVRRLDSVAPQVLAAAAMPVCWLPPPGPEGATAAATDLPPLHAWAGVSWEQDARETASALQSPFHAEPPDWVAVDHYAFDARWHRTLRAALGCRLLVIDDTGDRTNDADVLLDHNWDANHHSKYADRVLRPPRWLCGPRFALLSAAYRHAHRYRHRTEVRSIGIFMGGTDPGGASSQVLASCRTAGYTGRIEVVSTTASPHLDTLRKACAADRAATLTLDEADLAAFFARHDLQIGAGGGATWERCRIGVPAIGLILTPNQAVAVMALDRLGALRAARLDGADDAWNLPPLSQLLPALIADASGRLGLGERATALVDGRGAERVALALIGSTLSLRPATSDDARMLYEWRNHPSVRAVSANAGGIDFGDHRGWLARVLASDDHELFIAEVGRVPVGSIRFDRLSEDQWEVSLYLDPDLQGLGLGTHLLRAGEAALLLRQPAGFTVQARVVPGNAASQRLFETSDYHGGPLHYEKTVGPLPATSVTQP